MHTQCLAHIHAMPRALTRNASRTYTLPATLPYATRTTSSTANPYLLTTTLLPTCHLQTYSMHMEKHKVLAKERVSGRIYFQLKKHREKASTKQIRNSFKIFQDRKTAFNMYRSSPWANQYLIEHPGISMNTLMLHFRQWLRSKQTAMCPVQSAKKRYFCVLLVFFLCYPHVTFVFCLCSSCYPHVTRVSLVFFLCYPHDSCILLVFFLLPTCDSCIACVFLVLPT
jgi:hypothetical protein